jgi:glycosyltransferase involved in cell wall biosynthesis
LFEVVEVEGGKLTFDQFEGGPDGRRPSYTYAYLRNSYKVLNAALQLAGRRHFDVIHPTGTEFMIAALLLRRYSSTTPPVVLEISAANFSFATYAGSVPLRVYKVLQREVLKTTLGKEIKAIAVLGEFHKEKLKRQLRLPADFPMAVIPDAGAVPVQPLGRMEARRRLGLGDYSGTLFLFFGMIRKDKGIEYLLDAVARLPEADFRLLIAGSPTDYTEDQLRRMVSANPAANKIIAHFHYIPDQDVDAYFYACDALVLPYPRIYSGGSGPLLKGAAIHARPSIVTDVSEMGRLARAEGLGLLAEAESSDSLASQLRAFIDMAQVEREKMALNALAFAKQHTWDSMAVRFTELYKTAMRLTESEGSSQSRDPFRPA